MSVLYNREDSRAALPQLEKRITELERNKDIYVATINKTTYKEVVNVLKDGKIVFAKTSNSYGTYNIYPYSYMGTGQVFFVRMHGSPSEPQYKCVILREDNTWTTYTTNLATT